MRILSLGPAHPYRGGLAAFNERLARALQAEGHTVELLTFTLQYPGFLFPGKTQFTHAPAPQGLVIERRIHALNPLNWWRVGRQIRREKPDLILCHFWLPLLGPALGSILRLARRKGGTRVALVHNMVPHEQRPGDRLLSRYFAGSVDRFVCMSESVAADTRALAPHKTIAVSPHPVYDHYGEAVDKRAARTHLGLEPDQAYLLFFGFIRDYKGLDLLLEAMADARIRERGPRLIVAGEFYGNEETYQAIISERGIRDLLVLRTAYIPEEDVRYYFGAADLVVQPYKSATQSGISQLAYFFEKPMVVTRVGGLPEIVPHGEAGYVVEPEPTAIADAIVDFFDHDRADELAAGLKRGKERFSWKEMARVVVGGL